MSLCQGCKRILVSRAEWEALPERVRKPMRATHARVHALNSCQACSTARWKSGESDPGFVYTGGWKRRGLILIPAGERPPDATPETPPAQIVKPINHGTDGGYHVHRNRGETPCGSCYDAHRRAEKRRRQAKYEAIEKAPRTDILTAHAAYVAGDRSPEVVELERAYQRSAKRRQRAARRAA